MRPSFIIKGKYAKNMILRCSLKLNQAVKVVQNLIYSGLCFTFQCMNMSSNSLFQFFYNFNCTDKDRVQVMCKIAKYALRSPLIYFQD